MFLAVIWSVSVLARRVGNLAISRAFIPVFLVAIALLVRCILRQRRRSLDENAFAAAVPVVVEFAVCRQSAQYSMMVGAKIAHHSKSEAVQVQFLTMDLGWSICSPI